jgi:hypothetical protein
MPEVKLHPQLVQIIDCLSMMRGAASPRTMAHESMATIGMTSTISLKIRGVSEIEHHDGT